MKKVVWTPESVETYNSLVQYLSSEWGSASAMKFLDDIERVIKLISLNPTIFKRSSRYRNIRIGYLTKQCSLVYRVKLNEIELLLFWDNRQDSKKLRY
jgi:plasmid stabilization system protein ParE